MRRGCRLTGRRARCRTCRRGPQVRPRPSPLVHPHRAGAGFWRHRRRSSCRTTLRVRSSAGGLRRDGWRYSGARPRRRVCRRCRIRPTPGRYGATQPLRGRLRRNRGRSRPDGWPRAGPHRGGRSRFTRRIRRRIRRPFPSLRKPTQHLPEKALAAHRLPLGSGRPCSGNHHQARARRFPLGPAGCLPRRGDRIRLRRRRTQGGRHLGWPSHLDFPSGYCAWVRRRRRQPTRRTHRRTRPLPARTGTGPLYRRARAGPGAFGALHRVRRRHWHRARRPGGANRLFGQQYSAHNPIRPLLSGDRRPTVLRSRHRRAAPQARVRLGCRALSRLSRARGCHRGPPPALPARRHALPPLRVPIRRTPPRGDR